MWVKQLYVKRSRHVASSAKPGQLGPVRLAQRGIKQLTWPAKDAWNFNIVDNVVNQGACDYVEVGLRSARVLINCWGGVNRNVAVAVAYLILWRCLSSAICSIASARV